LLPEIFFPLKVAVLFLWGALSDERSGLSFKFRRQITSYFNSEWPFVSQLDTASVILGSSYVCSYAPSKERVAWLRAS
jgi:hypothetical protein